MNEQSVELERYERKDFESDADVRWCPGCGDYSILAQVQRVMPAICREMQIPRENIVFISGIGCSSRFPYYMNTYGFHTIHGRAPTIATGLRISRPDLQVWVVTGDGDGLSIGTNHLIHCLRRNIDIKILLFNNRIYGLTKGQYSPTSKIGKKTKSSPMGTLATPINPLYTAIASEATFVARAIATDSKRLQGILLKAARHRGAAFVEILQNCNVFNDGAFHSFADKSVRDERTLYLEDGKPLIFGKDREKAIKLHGGNVGLAFDIVNRHEVPEKKLVTHNESADPNYLARQLACLDEEKYPVPLGVFRNIRKPLFGKLLSEQIEHAIQTQGHGKLMDHLHATDTWEVK
ncbi:MAG: 2-oxoacid:ferredoxin oxidoreductase subunit beta [Gammaproteobacteria bacterium]